MNKTNVIAVDLAKNVYQICLFNKADKIISNREIRAQRFGAFLVKQPPSVVAFEACARAQHWARKAQDCGHEAIILPAKLVASFRQGQKTDGNDAVAIGLAARQPSIRSAGIKTIEQQSVQSDL